MVATVAAEWDFASRAHPLADSPSAHAADLAVSRSTEGRAEPAPSGAGTTTTAGSPHSRRDLTALLHAQHVSTPRRSRQEGHHGC